MVNAQTRLSAKGQVVIPKELRDELGWPQGSRLEAIRAGDGVLLRMRPETPGLTVAEGIERLRQLVHYEGPPLSIERLSWSAEVDRDFNERGA